MNFDAHADAHAAAAFERRLRPPAKGALVRIGVAEIAIVHLKEYAPHFLAALTVAKNGAQSVDFAAS